MSVLVSTLIADCPWKFSDNLPGPSRGAAKNYPCMTVDELIAFPSTWDFEVAADAYLLFWRVASMQPEALRVVAAWGFTVKTEIVWLKRTATGKRWFGMGRHVRSEHETCLVATRGRPQPLNHHMRSTFEGVVQGHSTKPDEFYRLVEATFPAPRAELFARWRRDGWLQFGNELPPALAAG